MFRKNYLTFLMLAGLFLLSSTSLFAQGSPITGKVDIKKADGTVAPVEGATITLYRTDAKMDRLGSVKTDAQGMYTSEAVATDQNFVLLVSAPNTLAAIAGGKGGSTVNVSLTPGDGSIPGDEEVRDAIKMSSIDPNSAEGQKLKAEREKKIAEINAKNEKAKASNEVLNRVLKEGNTAYKEANDAYNAKNYDTAITKFGEAGAKFEEGFQAAPDYLGSAPVMLNNKGNAMRLRGFSSYQKAKMDTANKAALMEAAKKDFNEAIAAYQKAVALTTAAPATDTKAQEGKVVAMAGLAETYRVLVGTRADSTKTKELAESANAYLAVETVPATKMKNLLLIADTLRLGGNTADAVPLYRKVLEVEPNNVDAVGGIGLSLYSEGAINDNKEQKQEGLNFMKKFIDSAPDTHAEKQNIKAAYDDLVTREKLTPQKVTTTKKKA
jgi:tetratricopeptide (TPR) repeat protein